MERLKTVILLLVISALIFSALLFYGCKPKTPPVNYQSQLDSLNGVIAVQDQIIDNMVADLDSLIDVKEQVRIVQGKKIIVYKSLTTPNKVQQFAERL
jgi:hypothetical protein